MSEGKRRGGQEGHKGNTLQKVRIPDEVIVHHAEQCKICGRKFSLEQATELVCTRQVFDIPEPKIQVIEHQVRGVRCCGLFQAGEFPLDITAPVQYGKRIKTLVSMLSVGYSRSRPKNSKGRNLLNRLKAYQASILAFAFEKSIPFTNNLAEQDIRCVKIKQKLAMCFRTFEGLKVYVRIKSVIKTFIKKGLNVFQNLLKINLNQKNKSSYVNSYENKIKCRQNQ